jgi:hypothetical protein
MACQAAFTVFELRPSGSLLREPGMANIGRVKEVHCVGADIVPARIAGGCGPPGGHKGRPSRHSHHGITGRRWVVDDRMNPITNPLSALPVRTMVAPSTIKAASIKIF